MSACCRTSSDSQIRRHAGTARIVTKAFGGGSREVLVAPVAVMDRPICHITLRIEQLKQPLVGPPAEPALAIIDKLRQMAMRQLTMTTREDRKSTRLNSSHVRISYAV